MTNGIYQAEKLNKHFRRPELGQKHKAAREVDPTSFLGSRSGIGNISQNLDFSKVN